MAATSEIQTTKLFPGFPLPVGSPAGRQCFPHAGAGWVSECVTLRELRMLAFVSQITDKPGWEDKVLDDEIVSRWRAEAKAHPVLADGDVFMSDDMFDFCIKELKDKGDLVKKTGRVNILDAEVVVVKSDKAISDDLQGELQEAVKILEDVPDHKKDWHPGAEGTVLDLVHPSLFPVVWGVTRALEEGIVPLDGCIGYTGKGTPTRSPKTEPTVRAAHRDRGRAAYSSRGPNKWDSFQWLPAEVAISDDGTAKITSYVNNLHPVHHKRLYPVLERIVTATVPLWEDTLNGFGDRRRVEIKSTGSFDYTYPPGIRYRIPDREGQAKEFWDPVTETYHDAASSHGDAQVDGNQDGEEGEGEAEEEDDDDDDDDWRYEHDFYAWKENNRVLVYPEPREYTLQSGLNFFNGSGRDSGKISLRSTSLQIIFKLANIYLSPEHPEYGGGSWHVEGTLHERICATAIYYYDQDNITDSHLAFRQVMDTEEILMVPEQSEFSSLEAFLGIQNESSGSASQVLGRVLTSEGRLLTFPNCLQHQVQPFELKDKTKAGHRKILAMFLIDPNRPVLSSAHVPPQRRDWWAEEVRNKAGLVGGKVPPEIFNMVIDEVSDFPLSWEQAVEYRKKLMEERGFMNDCLEQDIMQF
ncbi:hypothetical protein QBC42DRAFT_351071 [Cladorrhinum samala]|uniref:Duf1665 domain containing protein n=1 Tax=Cladorrhinum samala TaxID=585594 RepID=A0AAV9H7M8_9PEZI|nr:hypothetical protein QBC42DRAFT_351071 [Cladorrhinum samala]